MNRIVSIISLFAMILSLFMFAGCNRTDVQTDRLELNTVFTPPTNLSDGSGKSVKVVLLLGQSNATGCALNSYLQDNVSAEQYDLYKNGFSNVLINYSVDNQMNSSQGEFIKTSVGCGHQDTYFGPELGIAERLSAQFPDETIVILKYTYSGSCLKTQWLDGKNRGDLHKACIQFATTYMDALLAHNYDAKIGAICWMQGESDSLESIAKEYYYNQSLFVSYLREDLHNYADGEIYFIDAGIADVELWPDYKTINNAKKQFAQDSVYNIYFSTIDAGLTTAYEPTDNPDIAHYDSMSELKLGYLFAEQIIKVYCPAD